MSQLAPEASGWLAALEAIKPLVPVGLLAVGSLALWRMFGASWAVIDEQAEGLRRARQERGERWDPRPLWAVCLLTLVLMLQEYYGQRAYFEQTLLPWLREVADARRSAHNPDPLGLLGYDELWGHGFWASTRVLGYLLPLAVWRCAFPRDSLRDMGFRLRGLRQHLGLYALFMAVVVLAMLLVAQAPDFGTYYPFYTRASRSVWDLLLWEFMYFAQFFALEVFFRGWLLEALRGKMGSAAIFVMCIPYCMIHFGKPYLEVGGAVLAGIALGSLAMKTRSVYQGALLHITIALMMDVLALHHRGALPSQFWP